MNIDELLNRYFEGETSAEEEQKLRRSSLQTMFRKTCLPTNLCLLISMRRLRLKGIWQKRYGRRSLPKHFRKSVSG